MRKIVVGAAGLALLSMAPASAHHSGAMFDQTKTVELTGTVREFQWTNPHSFIQLVVPASGRTVEWSVEMGPPSGLFRNGWKPRIIKPGDKIKVRIHPTRDGKPGGTLISAYNSAGQQIGRGA